MQIDFNYVKEIIHEFITETAIYNDSPGGYNNGLEDFEYLRCQTIGLCDTFKLLTTKQTKELIDIIDKAKKEYVECNNN